MPLFGKKSPSGGKSSKEASGASSPSPNAGASDGKKVPTVEDKYTLKDLLGT